MRPLQVGHVSQRLPFGQFGSLVIELLMVLHIPLIKVYWFGLIKGAIWNVASFKTKMVLHSTVIDKTEFDTQIKDWIRSPWINWKTKAVNLGKIVNFLGIKSGSVW